MLVWLCIYGYAEDALMGDVRRQSGKYRRCAQSLHITNNIGHHCKKNKLAELDLNCHFITLF